jgi:hypothetical protein
MFNMEAELASRSRENEPLPMSDAMATGVAKV